MFLGCISKIIFEYSQDVSTLAELLQTDLRFVDSKQYLLFVW